MVVAIMKGYTIFVIILMLLYTARHFYFTIVRLLGRQRLYYNDILTDRMKSISVLIPIKNWEESYSLLYGILTTALIIISGFVQKQMFFILWRIHGLKGCGRMKLSENMSVKDTGNYEKLLLLINISLRK